jgi:hypothetical protein
LAACQMRWQSSRRQRRGSDGDKTYYRKKTYRGKRDLLAGERDLLAGESARTAAELTADARGDFLGDAVLAPLCVYCDRPYFP